MAAAAAAATAEAGLTPSAPGSGGGGGGAKLATRSPIPVRKGLLAAADGGGARPAAPCGKKTRDLPDLSVCHGCGLRRPERGRRAPLSALKSQWRLVLLCPCCRGAVRSGASCSYCLSALSDAADGGAISCLECRRRVHLSCLLRQRGYVVACDLDPRTFVCVDCRAVPKFLLPRSSSSREAASDRAISADDLVRNANYALAEKEDDALRARKKALEKALAARHAAEVARNALDLASLVSKRTACGSDSVDEQLALELHRAMNGSRRISRSACSSSSENLVYSKKIAAAAGPSMGMKKSLSGSNDASFEVQICMESKSFKPVDAGALGGSVCNLEVKEDLVVDGSMASGGGEKSECDVEEDHGKEEQASCSDKVFASAVRDFSAGSISAPSERSSNSLDEQGMPGGAAEGEAGGSVSVAYVQAECNIGDRYVKKYIRKVRMRRYGKKYCRHSRLADRADEKATEGLSFVLLSCQSLSSYNADRGSFVAQSKSLADVFNASANATRIS